MLDADVEDFDIKVDPSMDDAMKFKMWEGKALDLLLEELANELKTVEFVDIEVANFFVNNKLK